MLLHLVFRDFQVIKQYLGLLHIGLSHLVLLASIQLSLLEVALIIETKLLLVIELVLREFVIVHKFSGLIPCWWEFVLIKVSVSDLVISWRSVWPVERLVIESGLVGWLLEILHLAELLQRVVKIAIVHLLLVELSLVKRKKLLIWYLLLAGAQVTEINLV